MPARNFGVVQANLLVASRPTLRLRLRQVELLAFVGSFDDDQSGHDGEPP